MVWKIDNVKIYKGLFLPYLSKKGLQRGGRMYLRAIKLGDAVYVELPRAIVEEYNINHGDRILVPDNKYRNPFADFRVIHKGDKNQTEE